MKYCIILFIFFAANVYATCKRQDHSHVDTHVVRCVYTQQDIYRCYSKKIHCYSCSQRRKECFYCGCPIEEHSKWQNNIKKSVWRKRG